MTLFLTLVATVLIIGAVAMLYFKWLGRGLPPALEPWAVPIAWGALAVSAFLWATSYKPDFGLPVGFLIAMSLPLIVIAWRSDWTAKPEKERRVKDVPQLEEHWTPRRVLRIVARCLSSLLVAPVVGMAFGILAWLYMPGHEATRYAWAVFVFVMVYAICLVIGTAAQRPWRALGFITASGAAASAVVSLSILSGGH